ncbi:alpha/beta hydrolase [Novosphingobium profundi]|uniref:alpha/beta hydrolase n=1 Tax=Novosphingobium profundi TaxID=1774954 RepID=UPI001FE466C8|nr:alpha/beta hydrolase [Novosphingobium profundi]
MVELPGPFAAMEASALGPSATDAPAFAVTDAQAPAGQAVVARVAQGVLLHFPAPRSCGVSALVIGGGGYIELMAGREGVQVAQWLNTLGIDAHVLIHRFPDAENGIMAPLEDARAAMRLLRAKGAGQLGVVGLSSGGHLAACLLTNADETRPDFAVIGYAPISTNAAGRQIVPDKPPLAPPEKQAFYDALQPDAQLAPAPPPCFVVYAASDPVVPLVNAHRLASALEAQGAHPEVHVFAQAPHGFALDTPGLPVSLWPQLCVAWMRQHAILPPAGT